jgi:hypothetical protein
MQGIDQGRKEEADFYKVLQWQEPAYEKLHALVKKMDDFGSQNFYLVKKGGYVEVEKRGFFTRKPDRQGYNFKNASAALKDLLAVTWNEIKDKPTQQQLMVYGRMEAYHNRLVDRYVKKHYSPTLGERIRSFFSAQAQKEILEKKKEADAICQTLHFAQDINPLQERLNRIWKACKKQPQPVSVAAQNIMNVHLQKIQDEIHKLWILPKCQTKDDITAQVSEDLRELEKRDGWKAQLMKYDVKCEGFRNIFDDLKLPVTQERLPLNDEMREELNRLQDFSVADFVHLDKVIEQRSKKMQKLMDQVFPRAKEHAREVDSLLNRIGLIGTKVPKDWTPLVLNSVNKYLAFLQAKAQKLRSCPIQTFDSEKQHLDKVLRECEKKNFLLYMQWECGGLERAIAKAKTTTSDPKVLKKIDKIGKFGVKDFNLDQNPIDCIRAHVAALQNLQPQK